MNAATYQAIAAVAAGITGLVQTDIGAPAVDPWTRAPHLTIGEGTVTHYEQITMGAAGVVEVGTLVPLTLCLGAAGARPTDMQALAAPFPDRFRAAFMGPDRTLGGLVWDSYLSAGTPNLDTYQAAHTPPTLTWTLAVLEQIPANTPAL